MNNYNKLLSDIKKKLYKKALVINFSQAQIYFNFDFSFQVNLNKVLA